MRCARQAIANLRAAEGYLLAAQTARLSVILAAILFGVPLISPPFILIWGLLFDFVAVIVMAFEKPDGTRRAADPIISLRETGACVLGGLIWGALLAAFVPAVQAICVRANLGLSETMLRAILSASALFSSLVAASAFRHGDTLFRRRRITPMQAAWILSTVLFGVLILFTSWGAGLVGSSACGLIGFLALVPAAVVLVLSELIGRLKRKNP